MLSVIIPCCVQRPSFSQTRGRTFGFPRPDSNRKISLLRQEKKASFFPPPTNVVMVDALAHLQSVVYFWLMICVLSHQRGLQTREHCEERGLQKVRLQLSATQSLPETLPAARRHLREGGNLMGIRCLQGNHLQIIPCSQFQTSHVPNNAGPHCCTVPSS